MDPSNRFPIRPVVKTFAPYTPGGSIEEIKRKYRLHRVIKLASNENPLGTSLRVQRRISRAAPLAFRYPQSGNPQLIDSLSRSLQVKPDCLIAGNGSDELIDLVLRVVGKPGDSNVVVLEPSFSLYRMQAQLNGLFTRFVALNNDFSFPWDRIRQSVDHHTAVVFLTNPDNPSGYAARADKILEFADNLPQNTLLLIDEAYIDFASEPDLYTPLIQLGSRENILILRTFSKLYGLAGLRLGYGIMPSWLAEVVLRIKLPFSVNILAEHAGIEALQDSDFRDLTRSTVLEQRQYLCQALRERGFYVYPSQANFLLLEPPIGADTLFQGLLEQGVIIRPLDSYGLKDKVRISVGRSDENKILLQAIDQLMNRTQTD